IVFRWYLIVTRKPIQHVAQSMYQQSRSSLSGQLAVASTYLPGVDKQNLVESGPQSRGSRAVPGFTASRISAGSCLLQQIGLALRWQRFLVSVTSHFMVKRVTWNVLATEQ